MNSVTIIVLFLHVSLAQAQDCLCPVDQPLVIYDTPNLKDEKHLITTTKDCLEITSQYRGGYSVDLDGLTGYVNIDTGRIEKNCEQKTPKDETKRFLLGDIGLGAISIATAASCYIACTSCNWGTEDTTQTCFDVSPCEQCKELMCSNNRTKTSTLPPTTVTDHCRSSPCQNGGECRSKVSSYQCFCKTKYTPTHYEKYIGLSCEVGFKYNFSHQTTNIPQTTVNTMQSTDAPTTNGPSSTTLKQALGTFKVILKTSSGTSFCKTHKWTCLNGGLCVNEGQTYACYCQSSPHGSIITTGDRCELQIDLSQTLTPDTTPWLVIKGK